MVFKDNFNGDEMVSLTMTRTNMRELLVVTAINTTTLDMIDHNYGDKIDPVDKLGLKNAIDFGVSMIDSLSTICGVSREELKQDVLDFIDDSCNDECDGDCENCDQNVKHSGLRVHMNKSGEQIDDMVKLIFKNHGT